MKTKFTLLSALLLLSACAPLGAQFEQLDAPEQDKALVYYYRPGYFFGAGVHYDVHENDEQVTTLYNGGYALHNTPAGNKHIEATTEATTSLDFTAEKNKRYFVRGTVGWGVLIGRPKLALVPEEEALEEIKDCRLIEVEKEDE